MDVSENSGTPKSSIFIGFSIRNHPFWGTPIFGNTYINESTKGFLVFILVSRLQMDQMVPHSVRLAVRPWDYGTWISRWKLGSMVGISGLFHLLVNGVYWGFNPLILTVDPNFQLDIQVIVKASSLSPLTSGLFLNPWDDNHLKMYRLLNIRWFSN